jgi:hypothetical protein
MPGLPLDRRIIPSRPTSNKRRGGQLERTATSTITARCGVLGIRVNERKQAADVRNILVGIEIFAYQKRSWGIAPPFIIVMQKSQAKPG